MSFSTYEKSRQSGKPLRLYLFQGSYRGQQQFNPGSIGPYAYTNAEKPVNRTMSNGTVITFMPWPIDNSEPTESGTLDKNDITINMANGTPLDDLFTAYPPPQVVNLTIFESHDGLTATADMPAIWVGRINGFEINDNTHETMFNCRPVSSSLQQVGLRRFYQTGCPHVLYDESTCRADINKARHIRTVTAITGNVLTLDSALGDPNATVPTTIAQAGMKITLTAAGSIDLNTYNANDGTFDLIFSGGGGSGAVGTFTVFNNAVVDVRIWNTGTGYTSAPTVSFANCTGLVGAAATVTLVDLVQPLLSAFIGGFVTWRNAANNRNIIRTISAISADGTQITIRGIVSDLANGDTAQVYFGCNRTLNDCSVLHGNILNYGGQWLIPTQNPLEFKSQFY